MVQLTNGIQYNNHHLKVEFAEYLVANGFKTSMDKKGNLTFYIDNVMMLLINGNTAELYKYHYNTKGMELSFHQSHTGIDMLDINDWIVLMHIMNVVKLSDFLMRALKESVQKATEASFVIENLAKHLQLYHQ